MFDPVAVISPYASLLGFVLGLPATIATLYQSAKTRQEARLAREGKLHSGNCLEFVSHEGERLNLVPLETLHSLPRIGDVVFLPGAGIDAGASILPGAWVVEKVEHMYSRMEMKGGRPQEARLTKAVAQVRAMQEAAAA
ncbi:MAG: hypothetical protein WCE75_01475 [Terracidiphilus sp.]